MTHTLTLVPVACLKAHEETVLKRTDTIVDELRDEPVFRYPVIVDKHTYVILDGHHRYEAFLKLGLKEIPCLLVDYFSDAIALQSRRQGVSVTKDEVIQRALRGLLFPPKTTQHTLGAAWQPVTCEVPLSLGQAYESQADVAWQGPRSASCANANEGGYG